MLVRTPRISRLALLLALSPSALACDDDPVDSAPLILPYTQAGVPWVFDDDGHQYLIDTGTPRSFVTPEVARLPADAFTTDIVAGWNVLGVGEGANVVITNDLPPAILPMIGPAFGGIMGADILAKRPFVLDPWRGRIVFDDGDLREWMVESDSIVEIPVTIAGGGVSCMQEGRCFEHQGLRMLVEVELDGEPVVALVDTASTFSSMGEGLLERLSTGPTPRPELDVARGWDSWHFTRIAHTRVGEAELADMPVHVDPALDIAFARLSVEVNAPVELLIGHSLLLHFAAGFDYTAGRLTLARYDAPQLVETEMFKNFGFWPASSGAGADCFMIVAVAGDTATVQAGLDIGDCVRLAASEQAADTSFAGFTRALTVASVGDEVTFEVRDDRVAELGGDDSPPRLVTLRKRDLLPQFSS